MLCESPIKRLDLSLELVLELDGDFFGRKKKCVGAGISGGEPPWAHNL